jgi:hypothetical protein
MLLGALIWKSRTFTSSWRGEGAAVLPCEEDEQATVRSVSAMNPAPETRFGIGGRTHKASDAHGRSLISARG